MKTGTRPTTQRFVGFVVLLILHTMTSVSAEQTDQPNILIVLTDDQGWPTLGCNGGQVVSTPHLDRLAAEGVRFTDAYVTSQCTPTRATLLTGQYTARHGLWHVLPWYGYPRARMTEPAFAEGFPRDTFTIATGLRDAGYTTGVMGKWHLTSNEDGNYMGLHPAAAGHYGFDHAPPILSRDVFRPGADRGVNQLTEQAIDFIRENRDRPWFCFLSHHMIHGEVVAPDELVERYRRKGFDDDGPNRAVYLAGLKHIDDSIGRLMSALEDVGEAHKTMVIFLSDNGGIDQRYDFRKLPSPHPPQPQFDVDVREYDNAPLRAGKGSVYEGGVRVPMIIRWPGHGQRGSVIDTPVHAIDILPTAMDVAGAAAPPDNVLDGRSLRRLIATGQDQRLTDRPIFQYYPFYDLRWGLTPCASVRRGNHKLIEFFGDRVDEQGRYQPDHRIELYDLRHDKGESNDLSESAPELVASLLQELHGWMDGIDAEFPVKNPRHAPGRAFEETRARPDWLGDQ